MNIIVTCPDCEKSFKVTIPIYGDANYVWIKDHKNKGSQCPGSGKMARESSGKKHIFDSAELNGYQ